MLVASDRTLGGVSKTINAIDAAIDVLVYDMQNAQTVGYKATVAHFHGVEDPGLLLDMTQGSMEATGSPLDVAISGPGFFAVRRGSESFFTRAGNFTVNSQGNFVLAIGDGYSLVPPITLPTNATNVTVGTDGTVKYVKSGATVKTTAGQIKTAVFPSPQSLNHVEGSLYTESPASGAPVTTIPGQDGSALLLAGFLEQSNVELLHDRVRLERLKEWRAELIRAMDSHRVN